MRFHLFGLAHVPLSYENCICPFTQLALGMAKMVKAHGHELICYGAAGSTVACDEFVELVPQSVLDSVQDNTGTFKLRWSSQMNDPAWTVFIEQGRTALKERYRHGDIALITYGWFQKFVAENAAIAVEIICGYSGIFHQYRVFPSQAWRWHLNGVMKREVSPSWYDVVIPHYLDPSMFQVKARKQDYLAFISRLDNVKGLDIAIDVARATGKKLKVAGRLNGKEELPPYARNQKHVEYLGAVKHEARVELLSNARALLFPTKWVEAFGLVMIEALACGTPIISSTMGSCTEIVEPLVGIQCQDFKEFCEAVDNIRWIQPEACRRIVEEKYSLDAAWPKYEKYFKMILRHRSSPNGWYTMRENEPGVRSVVSKSDCAATSGFAYDRSLICKACIEGCPLKALPACQKWARLKAKNMVCPMSKWGPVLVEKT